MILTAERRLKAVEIWDIRDRTEQNLPEPPMDRSRRERSRLGLEIPENTRRGRDLIFQGFLVWWEGFKGS